jgi:uncharacterized protein
MKIDGVIWLRAFVDKIASKHGVETFEVEEALSNKPKIRRIEKGKREGEDVYIALGRTDAGRYLTILFIDKGNGEVLPLSARDMADKERRSYGRK